MKIRVLFISHYPGLGGANFSMISLIEHLRSFDIESHVLIPKAGPIEDFLEGKGIPYSIYKYGSLRTVDRGRIGNFCSVYIRKFINYITAIRIKQKFQSQVDIIHANSSLTFLGETLKRQMKVPLVWHLREFGEKDYGFIFPGGVQKARKQYENADALIAISKSINDYYRECICPNGRLKVIYNGVDEAKFVNTNKKDSRSSTIRLCIVGGISESKNQVELIRALNTLQETDFSLDIIGDGVPEYILELKSQIGKSLAEKVHFLGERKDIPALLGNYDIGIITSKNEAFGRVIIEYMLAGLAVIASNAGACPELIQNNHDGVLYELGNPEDLAMKLRQLIKDNEYRSLLADKAKQKALHYFTATNNARKIADLYSEILSKQ